MDVKLTTDCLSLHERVKRVGHVGLLGRAAAGVVSHGVRQAVEDDLHDGHGPVSFARSSIPC